MEFNDHVAYCNWSRQLTLTLSATKDSSSTNALICPDSRTALFPISKPIIPIRDSFYRKKKKKNETKQNKTKRKNRDSKKSRTAALHPLPNPNSLSPISMLSFFFFTSFEYWIRTTPEKYLNLYLSRYFPNFDSFVFFSCFCLKKSLEERFRCGWFPDGGKQGRGRCGRNRISLSCRLFGTRS